MRCLLLAVTFYSSRVSFISKIVLVFLFHSVSNMGSQILGSIVFAEAVPEDIAALSELNAQAQLSDALNAFFFDDWPLRTAHSAFYTMRVTMSMDNPLTRIVKAIDSTTGETMGFVALTISKGAETKPISHFIPPPGFNLDFAGLIFKVLKEFNKHFEGKDHCRLFFYHAKMPI